jgi:Tfp pilus assembly protein PilO
MAKFFYNVDAIEEITYDIDNDELERISEDEKTENREDLLKQRSKQKSQQNAENIQQQMIQMGHAFARMNQSLTKNLNSVNGHINTLLSGKDITDEEP